MVRRLPAVFLFPPFLVVVILSPAVISAADAETATPEGIEFFEKKIRPVLVKRCYKCHSAKTKKLKGSLRLDSAAGIRKGGDSGVMIQPGKVAESSLIDAIEYGGDFVDMPPDSKLPERVIADFRKWISIGAPLPPDKKTIDNSNKPMAVDIEAGRQFWSFLPVKKHPLPEVSSPKWPRRRLDHFVLEKLDENGMRPAEEANRRTLARRVSLDLIGLPPTYEEVESFATDASPHAYTRLVERLLASPHYGERWGRHWLDVARYAEDNPTSESTCKPPRFPYPYRDWVIRAFNEGMGYDEFVRRQLAADLMDNLPPTEFAALGFLGLSPVYHKEPKLSKDVISVIVADEWDERIDTITRGFLGLTVTCARCHDHKFDPITTSDYYALAGVMASTQLVEWPLVKTTPEQAQRITETRRQIVDYELRLNYAKKMRDTAKSKSEDFTPYEKSIKELETILERLKNTKLFEGAVTNAVRDAGLWVNGDDPTWTWLDFRSGVSRDLPIFIRGSVTNTGKITPRRFVEVLSNGIATPFGKGSGRLELAESIVTDAASLTARVIVNRVWNWHFGSPLVQTPSNFGKRGDRPSHPKLLDDLAAGFIQNEWSLKWLHRKIVHSATYRQASRFNAAYHEIDPDNRLLWRMNRKRLEAEIWRDAVLSVAGRLDLSMGGPSADLDKDDNFRRSVYGTVSRQKPADVLRLFDFPDAKRHSDNRILTTTPLQQLYLLNSSFLLGQASALAEEVTAETELSSEDRVRALFQRILLREPTADELNGALELISPTDENETQKSWTMIAHGLLASNEFLFVD